MPRVAASNGVRPELRALAVIKLNEPVTPAQINECVGTGDYAAKYISFLNTRYGFTITAQKVDRKVVSYTCIAEPKNVKELREMQPKEKVAKTVVPKAEKPVKKPKVNKAPAVTTETKAPSKAPKIKGMVRDDMGRYTKRKDDEAERLLEEIGARNAGEIGNFSVDPGWDSMNGVS